MNLGGTYPEGNLPRFLPVIRVPLLNTTYSPWYFLKETFANCERKASFEDCNTKEKKTKTVTLPTGVKEYLHDTPQGRGQTHTRAHTPTPTEEGSSEVLPTEEGNFSSRLLRARLVRLIYTGTERVWSGGCRLASATRPCVHEIRMSTWDSCCRAVTVKQIMSVGGNCNISLSR